MDSDLGWQILEQISAFYILVSNFKSRPAFIQGCVSYLESIEIPLTECLKTKNELNANALKQLSAEIQNLRNLLEKMRKQGKIAAFVKASSMRAEGEQIMKEIEKWIAALNLSNQVKFEGEMVGSFIQVLAKFDQIEEYVASQELQKFTEKFYNKQAAQFWITNFKEGKEVLEQVPWSQFIKVFSSYVEQTEHITLNKEQQEYLQEYLDLDKNKIIDINEFDNFYMKIWSFFDQKKEILSMTLKSKMKPNDFILYEPKQCILTYIESPSDLPEDSKQYCFKYGTEFAITKNGILVNSNFIEKNITGEEGIIIGNEKGGKAQIAFSSYFKSISREQMKIIYKENFGEKSGFYLLDLGKSITSFIVEEKPYILAKNSVINLSNSLCLTVQDLSPIKACWTTPHYYALNILDQEEQLQLKSTEVHQQKYKDLQKINGGQQKPNQQNNDDITADQKWGKAGQNKQQDDDITTTQQFKKPEAKQDPATESQNWGAKNQQEVYIKLDFVIFGNGVQVKNGPPKFIKKNQIAHEFAVTLGSDKANTCKIPNLPDFQCQFVYSDKIGAWTLQEKYSGPSFQGQKECTKTTLLAVKSLQEIEQSKMSSSQKLENGMKISMQGHIFLVTIK